ncbi:MAG: c-type cytochrome [Armatimonadota bacterium]
MRGAANAVIAAAVMILTAMRPGDVGAPPEEATAQQAGAKLPKGVTMEMVKQGREIYAGAGLCHACHGPEAKGVPNLGSDLSDAEWVNGDGSYEAIVEAVIKGVPAEKSGSGIAMPPRGGAEITDEQARAVAAYVVSLSHREK